MKLYVYSLYDRDAKAFMLPVFDKYDPNEEIEGISRAIAVKQFDPRAKTLYYLGTFDDNTGEISQELKELCNCELLKKKDEAAKDV